MWNGRKVSLIRLEKGAQPGRRLCFKLIDGQPRKKRKFVHHAPGLAARCMRPPIDGSVQSAPKYRTTDRRTCVLESLLHMTTTLMIQRNDTRAP